MKKTGVISQTNSTNTLNSLSNNLMKSNKKLNKISSNTTNKSIEKYISKKFKEIETDKNTLQTIKTDTDVNNNMKPLRRDNF